MDVPWDGMHFNYDAHTEPVIEYTGIVWRAVELLPYRTTDEQFVKTCHQFGGLALIEALERMLIDDWITLD